jgi:Flp pilus assembly protein TadG
MRPARRGRRHSRGQSMVEFALILPLLVLVALGATDLSRGYYMSDEITGASRAGVRAGIQSDSIDIGDSIRSEPNTAIPNTVAAWGNEGAGQANANCAGATTACGDPNGCTSSSVWKPGQLACFAVRSCRLNNVSGSKYTCAAGSYSAWQVRPQPCAGGVCGAGVQGPNGDALDIVVVYRFHPSSVPIANFVSGGTFLLRAETQGLELYY